MTACLPSRVFKTLTDPARPSGCPASLPGSTTVRAPPPLLVQCVHRLPVHASGWGWAETRGPDRKEPHKGARERCVRGGQKQHRVPQGTGPHGAAVGRAPPVLWEGQVGAIFPQWNFTRRWGGPFPSTSECTSHKEFTSSWGITRAPPGALLTRPCPRCPRSSVSRTLLNRPSPRDHVGAPPGASLSSPLARQARRQR